MAADYSALDEVAFDLGPAEVVRQARDAIPPAREEPPLHTYDENTDAAPRDRIFEQVRIDDLSAFQPEHPGWWWEGYMPAGEVTALSAHGGTGKSTLALILAAHIALGLPYLGKPTRKGRVLFFSAEDPANVLRFRLAKIARHFGLDCQELAKNLHILDATDGQPVLWADARNARSGRPGLTETYRKLRRYIETHQIDVLVADNASDVFAGDEISRASVRAFMQALAALVRRQGGAAMLLLHVNAATARGLNVSSDNYSGSTAWHNSARSRLFLKPKGVALELLHEKCNHGPKLPPLALEWPEGGLPQAVQQPQPVIAAIQARNDLKAVLRLIHEFTERGEFVTTANTGPGNFRATLGSDRECPQLKRADFMELLRDAERQGYLRREAYRNAARKDKQRFTVTPAGLEHIKAAPVAPVAPVPANRNNPHNLSSGTAPVAPVAPVAENQSNLHNLRDDAAPVAPVAHRG